MADRYWVGGTANWDGTAGTKWAATSGGAGGQSVPTTADDVFFDSASGAVTVTASTARNAKSVTCTGFTGTLTGTGILNLFGSVTLSAGMTYSYTGTVVFNTTATLTTAGKSFSPFTVIGSGITVTLGDALNLGAFRLTLTQGTFDTAGYNVTADGFSSNNANVRSLILGASTVTLSSTTAPWNFSSTNLTFSAGTSTIVCNGAFSAATFSGAGLTYNNVSFTNAGQVSSTITGANTFNTLSITGRTTLGVNTVSFSANQAVSTLTLSPGTNASMRTFLRSDTTGTARTFTVGAFTAGSSEIDFQDIVITGAAAPISGARFGDCKGNSGITFDAAKTVYFSGLNSFGVNWAPGSWALTPTGAHNIIYFPLAQDTVIFTGSSRPAANTVVTINGSFNIGTIDTTGRTAGIVFTTSGAGFSLFGNLALNTLVTGWTNTAGPVTFAGRGNQTIPVSAGPRPHTIDSPGGSVTCTGAFGIGNTVALTVTRGAFNTGGFAVTAGSIVSNNTNTREINLGTSTVTLAGTGGWNCATATGLTVTGTGTISLTSASTKTFAGGDVQTYPTVNQGGTGQLTFTGSNKFANITNTALGAVRFTGGTTNEFGDFNLSGTSTAARLTVGSTNTTRAILKKPGAWNVGAGSLDGGNNIGLSFT